VKFPFPDLRLRARSRILILSANHRDGMRGMGKLFSSDNARKMIGSVRKSYSKSAQLSVRRQKGHGSR